MSCCLLVIVVVGYINVGKILLLCMLMCWCDFGEVLVWLGIIWYVEMIVLCGVDGSDVICFFDILGLEDFVVLWVFVQMLDGVDWFVCICVFLVGFEVCVVFEQEVKVLW